MAGKHQADNEIITRCLVPIYFEYRLKRNKRLRAERSGVTKRM
jgi:hypothetical protein